MPALWFVSRSSEANIRFSHVRQVHAQRFLSIETKLARTVDLSSYSDTSFTKAEIVTRNQSALFCS
jgi:hypothetical protein